MATPTPSSVHKPHNTSPISTPIFKSLQKINWKNRLISTTAPLRFTGNNPTPRSSAATPRTPLFDSTTKKVMLIDWWLIKVQVEAPNQFKFGVGGKAFDGQSSVFFSSGEIVARHDEMTLDTVDNITITLASVLNRPRALENGFPSQVCDHFFLGFPSDWEELGAQYFGEQSIHGGRSSKAAHKSPDDIEDPDCLLSLLDDIPVTRLFDHMMASSGSYPLTSRVFDHILSEFESSSAKLCEEDPDQIREEGTGTPLHASKENNKPLVVRRCSLDSAFKDDQPRGETVNVILDNMPKSGQDLNFSSTVLDKSRKLSRNMNRSSGILTRSKARSKKLRTGAEDFTTEPNVLTKKISDPCPTLEAENSEKELSNRRVANTISKVNNQLLDRSGIRRSGRKKNVAHYRV
ncbi:uncharacterized protein LOC141723521 [Apium graveolens]|uniref:uncharacterized protein LOC141723521 n=1 Tax=Apium graveolens TaxID=4045 RepID=UPI003D7A949C